MMTFADFLEEVQGALNHLFDPTFQPSEAFVARMVKDHGMQHESWQSALVQSIQKLEPRFSGTADLPLDTRGHRLAQILRYRYVQKLTQEECAERLHITARHLRREQNEAVSALAQILWQQHEPRNAEMAASEQKQGPLDSAASEWSAQLRQELTALKRHASEESAEVNKVLRGVMELLQPVLQNSGIELNEITLSPSIIAAIPSVELRQLLVHCLSEWSRQLSAGKIEGRVEVEATTVSIWLSGSQARLDYLNEDALLQELLSIYGGTLQIDPQNEKTVLRITLPRASTIRILVVDDNEDLLHFYRRYLSDTRYQIIALSDGRQIFETIETARPDLIILDVMLPVTDGWSLLTELRQHSLSRTIPIIICSVIQEAELALALGANDYLAKPVRRSKLIETLDRVLRLADQHR